MPKVPKKVPFPGRVQDLTGPDAPTPVVDLLPPTGPGSEEHPLILSEDEEDPTGGQERPLVLSEEEEDPPQGMFAELAALDTALATRPSPSPSPPAVLRPPKPPPLVSLEEEEVVKLRTRSGGEWVAFEQGRFNITGPSGQATDLAGYSTYYETLKRDLAKVLGGDKPELAQKMLDLDATFVATIEGGSHWCPLCPPKAGGAPVATVPGQLSLPRPFVTKRHVGNLRFFAEKVLLVDDRDELAELDIGPNPVFSMGEGVDLPFETGKPLPPAPSLEGQTLESAELTTEPPAKRPRLAPGAMAQSVMEEAAYGGAAGLQSQGTLSVVPEEKMGEAPTVTVTAPVRSRTRSPSPTGTAISLGTIRSYYPALDLSSTVAPDYDLPPRRSPLSEDAPDSEDEPILPEPEDDLPEPQMPQVYWRPGGVPGPPDTKLNIMPFLGALFLFTWAGLQAS